MRSSAVVALLLTVLSGWTLALEPTPAPIPPDKAPAAMTFGKAPEGVDVSKFKVTLFAGEPDVQQPISFDIDDRGRLWVAECYSYPKRTTPGKDRILIFEDTDNDGKFDKRTVFWDKGEYLTSVLVGFGGVFICNAPYVQFIPDKNGDDVPDGEPITLLDGWTTRGVHNVVNGLTWGPDGWMYGLNGITAPSTPGKPGTPADKRVKFANGVWRYHPVDGRFEIVAHGTTNPWGLDFDEHGQMFITNCVIKHLFHVIPGARYERMFGQDLNPHAYKLLPSCANHIHWAGGNWTSSRGGKGAHDAAGGGHAHAGCMIYQGDNWPKAYRGKVFMGNLHGHRVNMDTLERHGSGYVAKHEPDFLRTNDYWSFPLEMKTGPDGGVYMIDWVEDGECHGHDAHRTSGRIYKITYGDGHKAFKGVDLSKASDAELVRTQQSPNAWYARHGRRILQERYQTGSSAVSDDDATKRIAEQVKLQYISGHHLRGLWVANLINGVSPKSLESNDENVRHWAIRLDLDDNKTEHLDRYAKMAANDPSPLVRLALASGLQRLPLDQRWPIAEALVQHAEDADDPNLPTMIWLGIEPLVNADRARFLQLAARSKIPVLRQHIARRLAAVTDPPKPVVFLQADNDKTIIYRTDREKPLLVANHSADTRPYIHPIIAPDGKGELTQFSPGHHKHQTGLYVGYLKVNGRDYFHNPYPNNKHFKRTKVGRARQEGNKAKWSYEYDLLDKDGKSQLTETQQWELTDHRTHYTLDLKWSAKAHTDVTFGQHPYGGLFLRMPWSRATGGTATNAEGKTNGAAEGQRSKWVDVGLPIEGRDKDDWGRIVIMDHPKNAGHPTPWRVDGQLGVGPARSRAGAWSIKKGQTARATYRLLVYTGGLDKTLIERTWKAISE